MRCAKIEASKNKWQVFNLSRTPMIQRYLRIGILLSSFPLLATNVNDSRNHDTLFDLGQTSTDSEIKFPEVQSVVLVKIDEKTTYKQYPVTQIKRPAESGYLAVNNTLAIAQIEEKTGLSQAVTIDQLTDQGIADILFRQPDSPQRLTVIESRKRELATDYVKDTLFLSLKGATKADKNNLFNLLTAIAELNLDTSSVVTSENTEETLKVVTALIPSAVESLNFETVKTADDEVRYRVTADALIEAIIHQVALLAKNTKHGLFDQLQQKEIIEQSFSSLTTLEFTIKSEMNKNSLDAINPLTGSPEQYTRTYTTQNDTSKAADATASNDILDGDWLKKKRYYYLT